MADDLNDQDIARILASLEEAQRPRPWPSAMQLSGVMDELRLWLDDDRQWTSASARNWQSLLQELERAIAQQPDRILQLAGDPLQLRAEVAAFSTAQKDTKNRAELAQRKKLERFLNAIRRHLQSVSAVETAWDCLLEATTDERDAAERFLAYARWAGHDAEELRKAVDRDLSAHTSTGPERSLIERLDKVRDRLRNTAASGDVVVWLLVKYARVAEPPVLAVGPNVTLYDADWLAAGIRDHGDGLPAELAQDAGALRVSSLARVREREGHDVPDALIRVVVDGVIRVDAVTVARNTAATIGAFGALYGGAEPSLWQVGPSFVTFYEGRVGPATFKAAEVGSPTIVETLGVNRDQTARVLGDGAERFGGHLPVRGGQMARVAQILRWLRDARTSLPPARLVLCSRAIEAVSAWAGFATPDRFVALYLAESWAWSRVRMALDGLAIELIFGEDLLRNPDGALDNNLRNELMSDPELRLERTSHDGYRYDHAALVRRLSGLRDLLPVDSDAAAELERVAHRFASPSATLAWYERLYRQGMANESRRTRTRNAVMHGGPLSDETIETAVPFAEYMASEAVDAALEAHLRGMDVADFVVERGARFSTYRQRLKSNVSPADVLFPEEI
jgi:hypothetical protein